jgi:hypothetical protein
VLRLAHQVKQIQKKNQLQIEKTPNSLVFVSFLFKENTERNPGTNGNTHGEKKDSMPKKNAINMFSSMYLIYTAYIFIKIYYLK